jgi:hypothetical protein
LKLRQQSGLQKRGAAIQGGIAVQASLHLLTMLGGKISGREAIGSE